MLSEDELGLLRAIKETGNLSCAAAKLGKAPSTVSHAARQLEGRLDALLFDRRRYRLQLTAGGELLVQESARIQQDGARLTRRVKQVARGWEEQLSIVCDEIFEFETFLPLLRDFDALGSGVSLRLSHERLGGNWEALSEGRADLVIGATNEPPAIAQRHWAELGEMAWVFAVSPHHPLARAAEPLPADAVGAHRAIVVGDSSRQSRGRSYGLQGGQATLAVPSMRAKILAQRDSHAAGAWRADCQALAGSARTQQALRGLACAGLAKPMACALLVKPADAQLGFERLDFVQQLQREGCAGGIQLQVAC